MAMGTTCQTPGANFHTRITPSSVSVDVHLGRQIDLTEAEAELLEANLHNALELVLARYWDTTTALCGKPSGTGTCTRIPGHNGGCAITSSHLPEHTADTAIAAQCAERNWLDQL